MAEHCFRCHGNEKVKAHINLEAMTARPDLAGNFKTWEKVIDMIERKEMPPDDEPQPADPVRTALAKSIRTGLDHFVQRTAGDPGPVVIRKLTSGEYSYSIEDLTGLTLDFHTAFGDEAVGGEGFANVGAVQFVQDSTLERYLDAAKTVAAHAVIGAGPLAFYPDPGKTGQELSAILRIKEIYRNHGFRAGSGEGGIAFGLDLYPKAFFICWEFLHRKTLRLGNPTLADLALQEGVDPPFAEHIWQILRNKSLSFPSSEIAAAWAKLPQPSGPDPAAQNEIRKQCDALYSLLAEWQTAFAANSSDDEEAPALAENSFNPSPTNAFRVRVNWARGAATAKVEFRAIPTIGKPGDPPIVRWRQPRLRTRGGAGRAPRVSNLKDVVSPDSAAKLRFGAAPEGMSIDPEDFVTVGATTLPIEFPAPAGLTRMELLVVTELDTSRGQDHVVRCVISDGRVEGETVASTGDISALLANPDGLSSLALKSGVNEFARNLPQMSHREPAPSDRDPIPPPFDNSYNNPERNAFHYIIKYHRDDRFLAEKMLDPPTRARLDAAWADLLTAFDYHDTYLQFVAKKFQLDLGQQSIPSLDRRWVAALPPEPSRFVGQLQDDFVSLNRMLKAAERGHLEQTLDFASRAWRRPLDSEEKRRLRDFYSSTRQTQDPEGHSHALRTLIARILMAPAFLYRAEEPTLRHRVSQLDDWELASRLSFFLWSSIPDLELRQAAAAGKLRDPNELASQARRMLRDPKARRFANEFFGQWFGFSQFQNFRGIDPSRFPEFTDEIKSAMHQEAVGFFEHIVREDRPVREILFADYTYLSKKLAEHYGIKSAQAPTNALARVDNLLDAHRGGILGMGAIMATTSAPLRTSAVKRGDWVLRRILGTPVPPPPGDAGSIPPDDALPDGKTVRQRLEAHRQNPSCVNCHSRIDPLGFALEQFDPIGRWRESYRDGQPIDTRGTLHDGTEIAGLDSLKSFLHDRIELFHSNLSSKLLGYALGRKELVSDRPLLDAMTRSLNQDDKLSHVVALIVTSNQFRFQRGRDSTDAELAAQPGSSSSNP